MTFEELMGVAHAAVRKAGRSTEFSDRVMIRAVVKALRDEMLPQKRKVSASSTIVRTIILSKFDEILASDGSERHPTTGNPVGTDTIAGRHPAAAPVCEWTRNRLGWTSSCDKQGGWFGAQINCPTCGKPIKFTEAAR